VKTNFYQLDYILNVDKFQKIQDDIAKATNIAIIAIDYKGNPITEHSGCSAFCSAVRSDPVLGKFCEKCDSRGGIEAARNQEAYIYKCHVGIVDIAVPIIVEDQYLGAIMAGQILLEKEENGQELESIVSKKYQLDIREHPELIPLYEQLHVMSLERIESVAHMIHHLVNYIVGEAVLKTSLYEANSKLHEESKLDGNKQKLEKEKVHHYYEEEKAQHYDQEEQSIDEIPSSSLLRPALVYISEHLDEKIYLEKMAYLCNISPSYFSKIFKRETGFNFSAYVIHTKLIFGRELLETTDQPILNISLNLGFDDCGYFIKLFRKAYNLTPAVYRKKQRVETQH